MPYKNPEDQKRYMKQHYAANKELYLARALASNKRRRIRVQEFVRELKDNPCTDCNVRYPYYVMQFDHLDPDLKDFNVGTVANRDFSISAVKKEIEKCELVCANCHAERTHQRRGGGGI